MIEAIGVVAAAATILFTLPDCHLTSTTIMTAGCRQVIIGTDQPPGRPLCGVFAFRWRERRLELFRYLPVAGPVEVFWSK
ncbi:hypothetical protein HWD94_10760 [Pseudarthrobacter equi]|uniref:hypothetical protein n=1 Tax=Pseudarthrobacter equi TaxID=728066 RepID=UPI0021BE60D1|nr:hypothetical protein [Pseudarthrobacter equi]MCT9625605.1 hypothetical protein [Pseudarthrobacter equi]